MIHVHSALGIVVYNICRNLHSLFIYRKFSPSIFAAQSGANPHSAYEKKKGENKADINNARAQRMNRQPCRFASRSNKKKKNEEQERKEERLRDREGEKMLAVLAWYRYVTLVGCSSAYVFCFAFCCCCNGHF